MFTKQKYKIDIKLIPFNFNYNKNWRKISRS